LPDLASAREESSHFSVSPYAGLCRALPLFAAAKGQEKGNVPIQTPKVVIITRSEARSNESTFSFDVSKLY
jgi:hypothetical protein